MDGKNQNSSRPELDAKDIAEIEKRKLFLNDFSKDEIIKEYAENSYFAECAIVGMVGLNFEYRDFLKDLRTVKTSGADNSVKVKLYELVHNRLNELQKLLESRVFPFVSVPVFEYQETETGKAISFDEIREPLEVSEIRRELLEELEANKPNQQQEGGREE